eukprot:743081-Amphidinium_carterae.1
MASSNTGMQVHYAMRRTDRKACVIKSRQKGVSFKSKEDEEQWRATTEMQLSMPRADNICQLYECIETPQFYFVVMERVKGQDLFEQLHKERLDAVEAREILRQILQGVQALHAKGRIHRDLKLENVVVNRSPSSPS